jgi:hypothetical protein
MDSIRVSEAPDTGSIPVEATQLGRRDFEPFFRFFILFKSSPSLYISRTDSLSRLVRYYSASNARYLHACDNNRIYFDFDRRYIAIPNNPTKVKQ